MTLVWDEAVTGKVNQERTATLTFMDDDVSAIYIDWGDGASYKKTEANYQWLQFTEPIATTTVSHTYTARGTFKPIIQTINTRGFVSRYYGAESGVTDIKPYTQDANINAIIQSDNKPTAVMRAQNISVNSGIDNSMLETEGPWPCYVFIAPTLTQAELNSIGKIKLEITGYVLYNKFDNASGGITETPWNGTASQQTVTLEVPLTGTPMGGYNILGEGGYQVSSVFTKIVKVKFVSPKATFSSDYSAVGTDYTTNELFNRLKIFICTSSVYPTVANSIFYPMCYVTAGCPIKSVDEPNYYSVLDFSQSRAAASNVAISNYRYDIGKSWFSPAYTWALGQGNGGVTDITVLDTDTKQTDSMRPVHYTYMPRYDGMNGVLTGGYYTQAVFYGSSKWYMEDTAASNTREDQVLIDDYGRFFPQYHDVRVTAEAASTEMSSVVANQPLVYLMHPSPDWFDDAESICQTPIEDYSEKMKKNGSTNGWIMTNLNTTPQKDIKGLDITHQGKDYIILAFDNPTSTIFFNATNYANGLMANLSGYTDIAGLKVAGIEYLHIDNPDTKTQLAYWKPVEFEDTTKITREYKDDHASEQKYHTWHTSLAKSGYLRFSRPVDWAATSIKKLCGGVYNTASGSIGTLAGSAGAIQPGADDVVITGSCTTNAAINGYGKTVSIANATNAQLKDKLATIGSASDVGAYKYALIIATGTAKGSMFWIASGANDGWDGNQTLTVNIGTDDTLGAATFNQNYKFPAGTVTGTVRRINIYDVIPGASKQFAINRVDNKFYTAATAPGTTTPVELLPVGAQTYNDGTSYFKNLYNMSDSDITGSAWATNSKYLLKITLSGATGAGTLDHPTPELWNIFDAEQGDSAIIEELDNSAYNLNSLAITSDLSLKASGQYFKAISRRGKVFVVKTGISLSEVNFSSVALGDESSSSAFNDHGPSTLYGHLHMVRKLQSEAVNVYWDEPQKDGTYVRIYGLITDVNETRAVGGPRAVMTYNFNVVIKDIALLDAKGLLMTDLYPLGGIQDERDYS